jgi:hypothetical protein
MKETAVNNFILKNVQRPVYKAKMLSIGTLSCLKCVNTLHRGEHRKKNYKICWQT